jgi:flagellar motor switch protein FliN/FliY
MSVAADLRANGEVAAACAGALGAATAGAANVAAGAAADSIGEITAQGTARAVSLRFRGPVDGTVTLVLPTALVSALEHSVPDENLLTAAAPVLAETAQALAGALSAALETGTALEAELADVEAALARDGVAYPLLDGDAVAGMLVVAFDVHAPQGASGPAGDGLGAPVVEGLAPPVLADVEMGVTAELGRCHMTMRELLALTPGAVIDLDRAANAPVDVLVNGTLIARGEVVVIDEEFGIRISEILRTGAPAS